MINTELLILEYLKKVANSTMNYCCFYVKASEFLDDPKKEYKLQLIENAFSNLVKKNKCRVFHIFNEDLFIFFAEKDKDDVDAILLKVKFYLTDEEKKIYNSLFQLYDTVKSNNQIKEIVQGIFRTQKNQEAQLKTTYTSVSSQEIKNTKKELTPKKLGQIEKNLQKVDFSSIMRRQSVCVIIGNSAPQPIFEEVFVSISDLQEILMPDINIASSPVLFKHLTEVLDKGVLNSVNKHDYGSLRKEFSLNLNTNTILSYDFGKFDAKISSTVKSTILLELNPSDVFSDLHTFIMARNFARDKGYKICLDAMSLDLMRYIDKDKLEVDNIKLFWSADLLRQFNDNKQQLLDLVQKYGQDSIIMARVDDAMGIDVGKSLGISLFQGRFVNNMLSSVNSSKRRVGSVIIKK